MSHKANTIFEEAQAEIKEEKEMVSNCCSAPENDYNICSDCKEPCGFVETE